MKAHTAVFIASTPDERRNQVVAAVDHETREAHRRICARATAIKKIKVSLAEKAIGLIEDPLQLAAVAAVEKRISVNGAIKRHPLWLSIPHEKLCLTCSQASTSNPLAHVTDATELLAAVDSCGVRCPVLLVKTLDTLEPDQASIAWQSLKGSLSGSSAIQVALAAGRAIYADGDIARGWADRDVIRLLWGEPFVTTGLLKIALNQRCALPTHWQPGEHHWLEVLQQQPRGLIRAENGPGVEFFLANWEHVPAAERGLVLGTCTTPEQVRRVLGKLRDEPLNLEGAAVAVCTDLLARYLDLDTDDRVQLMLLGGRSLIVDCLVGVRGGRATPEETFALMSALDAVGEKTVLRSVARLYSSSVERIVNREQRAVVDSLLHRLPVPVVFAAEGVVAREAHRLIWQRLDSNVHAETIAGLLPDWDGTVMELIEAATTV